MPPRKLRCEVCKRWTIHNEDSKVGIFSCKICGEFRTVTKFKNLFK